MPAPTRRGFLAAGAAVLAAPALQARNRLNVVGVGVIGCGARGKELALEVVKQGHAVVGLCDVAPFRLDAARAALSDAMKGEAGDILLCADYKKLLAHKAVDAVVIATPDHHHKEHLVAAVAAKKDVYVETPLTKSLDEHAEIADAVRATGRVVQVGLQKRSGAHWDEALRLVRARAFGRLVRATAWDARNWQARDPFAPPPGWKPDPKKLDWDAFLGPATKRPFDATRYWGWRWYWDYAGGLLTDLGTHPVDLFAWAGPADAPNTPKSAVVNGGRHVFDKWETPDIVQAVWDYGKFAASFSAEAVNGSDGAGVRFHGTKQTLVADEAELRLYDTADRLTPGMKPVKAWKVEPETPAHVKNWLECVDSREEPAAPVALGLRAGVTTHLATLAYRTGRKQFWDADRNEVIGGG